MKPKHTLVDSQGLNSVVNVVLITLDGHVGGAFNRARSRLQKVMPSLSLAVHAASDWDTQPERLSHCIEDIEAADVVYNELGVKFLPLGNTGNQMGGWYNKEINSVEDFQGLKFRMPGIGGKVLEKLGASVILLAGGDVLPALASGAIDGTEWIGPAADLGKGLHQAAKYYYNPGWHEPATILDCSIDLKEWESLDDDTRSLITQASKATNMEVLSRFQAANDGAYQKLINEHGVQMRQIPDEVMNKIGETAAEVLTEYAAQDSQSQALFSHLAKFRSTVIRWTGVSEKEYLRIRNLPFKFPNA